MPLPLPFPPETPLDLTDPALWILKANVSLNAPLKEGETAIYERIPEYFFPQSFNSPILLVQLLTTVNTNNRKGGRLLQTQLVGAAGGVAAVITARRLWLGSQILRLPQDLQGFYNLRFLTVPKLPQVSLLVYEFV